MEQIETLSSVDGRKLLFDIFQELRFEKQLSSMSTLTLCWRICTHEREIFRYVKKEVTVIHPLGFFSGTALWLEEIVNRFYYSTINSFVYLGAALLLVLIGIRRFSDTLTDTVVILGISFEALMLVFLFVVMLFSPQDEAAKPKDADDQSSVTDLILEVGEIATDFAAVVVQLEELGKKLNDLVGSQLDLVDSVNRIADTTADAVAPNPLMLETMGQTNVALIDFKKTVENLNIAADALRKEEIEFAVRKEVERILVDKIYNEK